MFRPLPSAGAKRDRSVAVEPPIATSARGLQPVKTVLGQRPATADPPRTARSRAEPAAPPPPVPVASTSSAAAPSAAEKAHERALMEKRCLLGLIDDATHFVASLEAQCEAAVNLGDARLLEHRQTLHGRLRKLEQELREARATRDDLREAIEEAGQREKTLDEEVVRIRSDTQRLRDSAIPMAEGNISKFDEVLAAKHHAVADRQRELDSLREHARRAQSITYGLSSDAAAVVTATEENRVRRQRAKDEAMRQEVDRRLLFNEYEQLKGTIRVYCRVKGGSSSDSAAKFTFPECNEVERQSIEVVQSRSNATSTGTREAVSLYQYDRVFGPHANQEEIFLEVGTLVDSAVDGYKACAFAYGQTGSGKTFTMEGSRKQPGIIPRSIDQVFKRIGELRDQAWEYTVSCSFIEIYNDCLRNLLDTSEAYHREFTEGGATAVIRLRSKHDIVHVGRTDTTISGVKDIVVKSPADIHKLLEVASRNRSVAKTNMNERSSRSHCVFTMRIVGSNRALKQRSEGVLCLIDLAGSERVNESGAEGKELKEAIAINRSLMHLGDCISSLGSNQVVSWRNSRLTYLLQNFLGGDGAKMLMFVMVSDREEHVAETNNSLRFASKVNATQVGTAKKRINPSPA
jgi:kinesin family protein C1